MKNSGIPFRIRLADSLRNFWVRVRNRLKRRFRKEIGFIVIEIKGALPEFRAPLPRWQRYLPFFGLPASRRATSLADIREAFERISLDPRPIGILIKLESLNIGWAKSQSLREEITRFKESGKRVIAYCAGDVDTITYYVACAADSIYAPPGASWAVLGLRAETIFLKDALNSWGIEAEVFAVSPYKTAGDMFSRADMSDEHREMLSWILDGQFDLLVQNISEDRDLKKEDVIREINRAPFMAEEGVEAGLLDGAVYFDDLANILRDKSVGSEQAEPAQLVNIEDVYRQLCLLERKRSGKMIGVISIRGPIIPGESRETPIPFPLPLLGSRQTGSESIAQMFRSLEQNDHFAAVVLHVDSPGGSSLASDLIWREVERVRKSKPVVVYMGDVAASGGYYVAAGADWIVAQPLSVTGSIGVVFLKLLTKELFSRFMVGRVSLQRGEHAGIYSDDAPLEPEMRSLIMGNIERVYQQFKTKVGEGRGIDSESIEEISGGRVWLGFQAQDHALVDSLGDLRVAIEKARELAKLPPELWTPAAWIFESRRKLLPVPFPIMPADEGDWLQDLSTILSPGIWMIEPFTTRVR